MRTLRTTLALMLVLSVTVSGFAQNAATPATPVAPVKSDPILKVIPADTMGFAVINNLKTSLANTDKFLVDIGLAPMVQPMMPNGLLGAMKDGLTLGPAFSGDGGLAVCMLDMNQFGLDVSKLLAEDRVPDPNVKLPFIVYFPGGSIKDVFPNMPTEKVGQFTQIMMPFGPMMAVENAGYIMMSPGEKALTAALKAPKMAAAELKEAQAKMIAGSDLAIYINMKVSGPSLNALLKVAEKQMPKGVGPDAAATAFLSKMLPFYQKMLNQVQDISLGFHFAPTGLMLEEVVEYVDGSTLAKSLAGYKAPAGSLVDKLPNLPYVLAFGCAARGSASTEELFQLTQVLDIIGDATGAKISDESKAKINALTKGFSEQVEQIQFVGGGAAENSGVFGLAMVIKCKDSAKMKALFGQTASTVEELIKTIAAATGGAEEVKDLKINFFTGAETIDGASVDTIEVTDPHLKAPKMTEKDLAEMTKVLGEGRIRAFIAYPDATTVVVTIGGGKAFTSVALKTAKAGGNIPQAEGVAEVTKMLPKNLVMVGYISVGNLFDVIAKGCQIMGEEAPPFKIATRTPIALGAAVNGNVFQGAAFIPTPVIKEAVTAIMSAFMPTPKPAKANKAGGADNF